MSAAVG